MATLTFVLPDGSENAFELSGQLTVGREDGNDVVLAEGGLSRKHCRFYEEDGQVLVEDLGSSNGTFVDGERIEAPTAISEGQEILVANVPVQLKSGAAKAGTPRRQATAQRKAMGSSARTGVIQSPVAGKRPGSRPGASGARSTGAIARRGNAAPAMADEESPDAAPQASARATLKGMTGPWAGKRYALSKVVSVVGRVEGNDVAIDDNSVSRRHAEIRKSGPGYAVRDLQSANGTFVNGERITEAPLRPGDVIKFGVVEFGYSGPSLGALKGASATSGMSPEKKKKLMIGVGAGVFLVVILGIMVHAAVAPPPIPPEVAAQNAAANAGPQQIDPQQLLGMCRSFSDTDGNTLDWKRAIDACDQVIKADPINTDARKLKKLAEFEESQKEIFDHAHELFGVGQEEAAMAEFDKLDSKSFYFAQARSDFRKAADIVKIRRGQECIASEKALQSEKAWVACKAYEDLASYRGFEDKYQRLFVELQRRYKGKDEWQKPVKYARFLQEVVANAVDSRFEAIKKMYSDADLANAINLFAKDPVAGRLAVIRYRSGGKDSAKASQILQYADTEYSKHQAAYEKMLRSAFKEAAVDIRSEMAADHALMPKDFESDLVEKDRETLADNYADLAKTFFTQQRFTDAYKNCVFGSEFTKASISINNCFADLEKTANALGSTSCENIATILSITRPESVVHKNADAEKAKQGCN